MPIKWTVKIAEPYVTIQSKPLEAQVIIHIPMERITG
jgi:hypothetical protein